MSASTVVPTAIANEFHIAPTTSCESNSFAALSSSAPPGSIFEASTSLLVLVAETTMKYSGKREKIVQTVRNT